MGAVAGNPLPLIVKPRGPSLSTIVTSWSAENARATAIERDLDRHFSDLRALLGSASILELSITDASLFVGGYSGLVALQP